MTADVLRDYMLGRLDATERRRVRDRLRVDPGLRGTLRRLRNTTLRVRARLAGVGAAARELPADWLPLIERVARNTSSREPARAEERPKTWLRAGAGSGDERKLTWL